MQTRIVDQLRGDILADAMKKLQANPKLLPADYYAARVEPGVGMLVEPINDAAFVFVPPTTVHVFPSEPGSGTGKLRQRMIATLFFERLVEAAALARPGHREGAPADRGSSLNASRPAEDRASGSHRRANARA